MLLRNVVQQTSKNVFGNFVGRQSVLLCLSKTQSVNRWSSGNDGGEAMANALCKYRKSKWFMGMFSCKKYFGNRHSLLHSTRLSCSKQHRVVVVAAAGAPALPGPRVTGARAGTGPAEINRSLCRCRSDCKTGALDVRFIGLLLSTSFLYLFSASL